VALGPLPSRPVPRYLLCKYCSMWMMWTHLSHSSDSSLTMKDRTLMVSLWLTEAASCDYLWNDFVAMLFVAYHCMVTFECHEWFHFDMCKISPKEYNWGN